ncbi:MAG: adenylyl cyclase, partial [Gammaproteobacteria bacterium]|nr:adenylyl cyclase [Gammaproteobacteria bacterium]
MSLLGEVKRRKIFQVAAVYTVVAWLLIQIVATVEEPLNLPDWFDTAVIVLLAVGFPIALILSWGFNLTVEGIAREGSV